MCSSVLRIYAMTVNFDALSLLRPQPHSVLALGASMIFTTTDDFGDGIVQSKLNCSKPTIVSTSCASTAWAATSGSMA